MGCIGQAPAVSRLQQEWKGGTLVQLEMENAFVREFAKSVNFEATPYFILFDGQGKELKRWRGKAPALSELP
jgi:thioredoxin-related protein